MAATLTKTAGPTAIGAGLKMATYTVLLDTVYATGGEPIDLTGEFDYIHFASCGANDTAADNYMLFNIVHPGSGTAVTSTNVTVTACWSADGTDGEIFKALDGGDLSAVGELQIMIIGK